MVDVEGVVIPPVVGLVPVPVEPVVDDEEDDDVVDLDEELHPDDVEEALDVVLRERTVAAVRVDDARGSRLNREPAAEEREAHDEQREILDELARDVRSDQEGHATGHGLRKAVLAGRDGEQQRCDEHEARDPRGQQRADDRARHALRGLHHLLGNVARRLEAVEDVDVRQDGHERRPQPPVATEVDAERIGVWGGSYAGGHVLVVGAIDRRVKCVVSQAPFISGHETFRAFVRADFIAGVQAQFNADREARLRGEAPAMVPVVD